MKNNILTIMKKEFHRFFSDKRMVFTTILMPGLMIFILYTFMGEAMQSQFVTKDDYQYEIYADNLPDSMKPGLEQMKWNVKDKKNRSGEEIKTEIAEKKADLYMVFPENFDEEVAAYDSSTGSMAPNIELYYNSTKTESSEIYYQVVSMLDTYEGTLANKFDINEGISKADLASEEEESAQFFAMMLPMLMLIFMFSGCTAIAPESIAGEKERGTIATLLVTPVKRSHLAVGKIVSLSVIGLLSGLSSFVGTMISIPKMMGGSGASMDATIYGVTDYVLLLLVILSTVLIIIAAISVISGFAKSVKEASTAVTPLMIICMVVGVTGMFGDGAPSSVSYYLIPLYNSVQAMNGIFSLHYDLVHVVVTVAANLFYTLLLSFVLAKLFDSEKMMYL
ncbi:MAG: ABC transporter permease subunit [Clostridiales bacterium]|nr:ABC transporter permease subunit [Clostridiales bacterium]